MTYQDEHWSMSEHNLLSHKRSVILLLFSFILCIPCQYLQNPSMYVHPVLPGTYWAGLYNSLCIYTIFPQYGISLSLRAVLLNDLSYWSSDNKEEENL